MNTPFPEYLVDVSTIGAAFRPHGESALNVLLGRLSPKMHTHYTLLGDFASLIMAEVLQAQAEQREMPSYEECWERFFNANRLKVLTCKGIDGKWHNAACLQMENITRALESDLPQVFPLFDAKEVHAEQSFTNSELGLQGRVDFIQSETLLSESGATPANSSVPRLIIEQKAGKAANDWANPTEWPEPQISHIVQALLYSAMLGDQATPLLFYSRYPHPIATCEGYDSLLARALALRNDIVKAEMEYAESGYEFLDSLSPDDFNIAGLKNNFWKNHLRPGISKILEPIQQAPQEDKEYYFRMMQFVQREMVQAKLAQEQDHSPDFFRGLTALLTAPRVTRDLFFGRRNPAPGELRLIVGPPGTGKTSFGMLNAVKKELERSKETTVAIMAYTNRAVDEICEKLDEAGIAYQNVRSFTKPTRVVVGTVVSFNARHYVFNLMNFSLCIVDEASQVLEPQLAGIIAKRVPMLLIGDHKQLPAVCRQSKSPCAKSIFERYYRQFRDVPGVVTYLKKQGRMHQDIMQLSNKLFYGGELSCVPLPHQTRESASPRVTFTNIVPSAASPSDPVEPLNNSNRAEAEAILRLLDSVPTGMSVGIIVPYNDQIALIKALLVERGTTLSPIVDTVERFQGSQCDVIIFGFTATRPEQLNFLTATCFDDGGVTIDRKLNVAITRAREYMHIVGNARLLSQVPLYKQLIESIA